MIRFNILFGYIALMVCITCISCVTYKALPVPDTKAIEGTVCSPILQNGSKIYCETNGMYASLDPYNVEPCEKLQFETTCGPDNSGSVFWDFGDGTTSSLKIAQKTYETAGDFEVNVVCTFVDGSQITATFPLQVVYRSRYRGYGYGVTEIKTGDTSCPRIELKE